MTVRYAMERCPVHGLTTFGTYYGPGMVIKYGCLDCHFAEPCDAPACAPVSAESTDTQEPR